MYIHTLSPKRHGCSIKFLSTRSVQRRPRCILWWSHDVVPRLAEGGRRKAEHRGAMSRGVQRHPHTLTFTSMFLFTEPSSVFHQYLSLSLFLSLILWLSHQTNTTKLYSRRVEAHRRQARLLTVDSIAGGVLMEAEICDLDELTSGQRGSPPSTSAPLTNSRTAAAAAASRALF